MASPYSSSLILQILLFCFSAIARAQVPQTQTFHFINQGQLEYRVAEYDATYRPIRSQVYSFSAFPFQLCLYNTTPNAFVLAIGAGSPADEYQSRLRWVWDANRNRPVRENATLALRRDGNLVLTDSDGSVAWQTNTANKGVTGIKLLPNGNLVLHDKNGRFVWQSFDHPTDTLLVGQSLRINGRNKLISRRTSDVDGSDGPYGIMLDSKGFNSYVNNSGKLLVYGGWRGEDFGSVITFDAVPENNHPSAAYVLVLTVNQNNAPPQQGANGRRLLQVSPTRNGNQLILNELNYNATYSYLRLGSDGNLRTYTYYDKASYLTWKETFAFFSSYFVSECQLPSKCGAYGLCDSGMCVACPSPNGLLGWREGCAPPKVAGCASGANAKVDYYKIVGVDHFLTIYLEDGEGPMKLGQCREKCSRDCKCMGFFYKEENSKCLLAPTLGTLIYTGVNTSAGYIKYSK